MKNKHYNKYDGNRSKSYDNGVLYFSGEVEPGDGRTPYVFRLTHGQVAILTSPYDIQYGIGDRVTVSVPRNSVYEDRKFVLARVIRKERPKIRHNSSQKHRPLCHHS